MLRSVSNDLCRERRRGGVDGAAIRAALKRLVVKSNPKPCLNSKSPVCSPITPAPLSLRRTQASRIPRAHTLAALPAPLLPAQRLLSHALHPRFPARRPCPCAPPCVLPPLPTVPPRAMHPCPACRSCAHATPLLPFSLYLRPAKPPKLLFLIPSSISEIPSPEHLVAITSPSPPPAVAAPLPRPSQLTPTRLKASPRHRAAGARAGRRWLSPDHCHHHAAVSPVRLSPAPALPLATSYSLLSRSTTHFGHRLSLPHRPTLSPPLLFVLLLFFFFLSFEPLTSGAQV